MRMPVMNGYQATKQIKSTIKGKKTFVIAVTASTLPDEIALVLSTGCEDYVRKPFEENSIFEILEKYLGVSFIYQENPIIATTNEPLNQEKLKEIIFNMPKYWLESLHKAALDADSEGVVQLIELIPNQQREIQILNDWVYNFEFEKIIDLLQSI